MLAARAVPAVLSVLSALPSVVAPQEPATIQKGLEIEPRTVLATARRELGFSADDSVGVFVGVNEYVAPDGTASNSLMPLRFAVDDAVDLAHMFVFELALVRASKVRLQLSGRPAKEETQRRLAELRENRAQVGEARSAAIVEALRLAGLDAGPRGLFVFGCSSHGMSANGRDVLLAADSQPHLLEESALFLTSTLERIETSPAQRRIAFIDACRNRAYRSATDPKAAMQATFMRAMQAARGLVVFGATVADGFSFEDVRQQNGVFTAEVMRGLRGAAPGDALGLITAETLSDYLDAGVKDWVARNAPAEVERCTGITMNVEDQRSKRLPLSVNIADYERAEARRSESAQMRTLLCESMDFEILRGEHAQALWTALQTPGALATEVASRLRGLRRDDADARHAFVAWWTTQAPPPPEKPAGAGPVRFGLDPLDDADLDGNDAPARASKIGCRSSFSGHVGSAKDPRDVFVFAPEADGTFVFTVQNDEESSNRNGALATATLSDAVQQRLHALHPNEIGPGGSATSPPIAVSGGNAYYVELAAAQGHAAAYSIACAFFPLDQSDALEPNAGPNADLPPLDIAAGLRAKVGYGEDAQDWYCIAAPDHGLLSVTVSNEHESAVVSGALLRAEIRDANDNPLAAVHPNELGPSRHGTTVEVAVARAERCYLRVEPATRHAAPYRIDVHFVALTCPDAPQVDDALQTAGRLIETTQLAHVGFRNDPVDYWRYDAKESCMVELAVRNLHRSRSVANGALDAVSVLQGDGSQLASIHPNEVGPSVGGEVQFKVLAGSAYYVRIRPATPLHAVPYQISLRRL